MEIHRALLREAYGHPDILVSADGQPGSDWLVGYFVDQVRNGVRFEAGQTVQIGWALLKLLGSDTGGLSVFEPDFASMPVRWVEGSSRVMRHLIIQREVCALLGEDPYFPSMIEPAVISSAFISGRSAFSMLRDEEGWLFKAEEDEGHHAQLSSLYAVGIDRTAVIPFLALPQGVEIRWQTDRVEVRLGEQISSSDSSDFLHELHASGVWY